MSNFKATTMSIKVTASSDHTESPLAAEFVQETLKEHLSSIEDVNVFTGKLAEAFSTKSSKHKFLILVTSVAAGESVEADLKVKTSVGAIWEPKKDGYYSFEVKGEDSGKYLITVFWISVD